MATSIGLLQKFLDQKKPMVSGITYAFPWEGEGTALTVNTEDWQL